MAKPKLALIPAAQGSKLFSVLPSSGVGDFDFTRSGSATRINSQGLIEEVGNGVSRLNYPMIDGKVVGCPHHILEPSRTNLYPYSNDVSFWSKSNVVTTSNYAISPDGTQNAFRAAFSTSTGALYINALGTTGVNNTLSVWAKSNNGSSNKFRFFGNGFISISDDYIATEEWQRFEFTYSCTNLTSGLTGASDSATNDILFYGFQHEVGSYATSYIPTNGAIATRLADQASGSGNSSLINSTEGVLYAEIAAFDNDTGNRDIYLSDTTASNRVRLRFDSSNNINVLLYNGSTQFNTTQSLTDAAIFNKIAFKYKTNDFALWVNGTEVATDTIGTVCSGLNDLSFWATYVSDNNFYGKVKALAVYKEALTDIDIEELTSWESFILMANGQNYTIK